MDDSIYAGFSVVPCARDGKGMAPYRPAISIASVKALESWTLTSSWTCVVSSRTYVSYFLSSVTPGIVRVIISKSQVYAATEWVWVKVAKRSRDLVIGSRGCSCLIINGSEFLP